MLCEEISCKNFCHFSDWLEADPASAVLTHKLAVRNRTLLLQGLYKEVGRLPNISFQMPPELVSSSFSPNNPA